jgi:hypothetical protein
MIVGWSEEEICTGESNDAVLQVMQDRADSLDRNIDDYAEVLGDLARPRKDK